MLSGIVIELQCTPNKNYNAQSNSRRCTHSEVLIQMFFLNKSVQLLLLLVLFSQGQGAPSHEDQLAAEEDEEIEDSEDNFKVFEAGEQKTQEAIDSMPGVSGQLCSGKSGSQTRSFLLVPQNQLKLTIPRCRSDWFYHEERVNCS